ncbi:sulfotransferase family protein [Vreelandella populi]|uniref:sulfotransferase family protein n=1 Tax=Vreelandella populi TaxID=2498858 RepID=UPI000F8EA137|nr:sulfotransferase [Halomonas populi]RUR42392.1 sulfotransferase [Halomonas populi]
MLPNFLCIGSQKAGTSWLYQMLKQHPDIWLPPIKEVHYYDYHYGEDTGTKKWGPSHIKKAMKRIESGTYSRPEDATYVKNLGFQKILTPEWYESIFNHVDSYNATVRGEVTPEYCSISPVGIEKIKEDLNTPKIIWLIRDPIERAVSQIKMVSNRSDLTSKYDDWSDVLANVRYLNRANYKKYMPIWDKFFGSNILYLPYGLISKNPVSMINEIERFLEVSMFKYDGLDKIVHKTKSLNIPSDVLIRLEDEMSEQYAFLSERFSEQFLKDIK